MEDKRDYMKEILLLKSAFSVIDEMFHQEIINAQKKKSRWFPNWCFHYEALPRVMALNPFIDNLMDPFKDRTKDDIARMEQLIQLKEKQVALNKKEAKMKYEQNEIELLNIGLQSQRKKRESNIRNSAAGYGFDISQHIDSNIIGIVREKAADYGYSPGAHRKNFEKKSHIVKGMHAF
jgi:hypothetical protein